MMTKMSGKLIFRKLVLLRHPREGGDPLKYGNDKQYDEICTPNSGWIPAFAGMTIVNRDDRCK